MFLYVFWVNWPLKSLLHVRKNTITWLWHNDGPSSSDTPVLLSEGGGTGCKWSSSCEWKSVRKRAGMMRGSSDGEKGQHSTEARGVLVEDGELWHLVHFKSVSSILTFGNICIERPRKHIFSTACHYEQ